MKRMKGVLAMEPSSFAGNEDPKTRFKHQSLMQGEIWFCIQFFYFWSISLDLTGSDEQYRFRFRCELQTGPNRTVPTPKDYLKRFKAEKANIIIASSTFIKGFPAEHELYRELTITLSPTIAKVFAMAERYTL
ncbi:unnamed protein product [Prunus armeniaca]